VLDAGDGLPRLRRCMWEEIAMAEVKITVKKNGPYIVNGLVDLTDAEGNAYPVKVNIALCRCGASTTKPFCDGTHSKIGFQAAEQAVPSSAE
jgi:CDGSH-type Zn-finger protein